ncbi:MAG: hypothetical protein DDG58_09575 [Ardenticatenia bacterium]|nr:MAG: hypothetical protein DDG58_09575 [Ardenticatenia bacterium]
MNREFHVHQITRRQFLIGQAVLLPWLAIGWRQNVPSAMAREIYSADLRHMYPPSDAGHWYARSAPVVNLEETLKRLALYSPHLAGWLVETQTLIKAAIQTPQIVCRQLPYRSSVGHYRQVCAVLHPTEPYRYVTVTLSLANLPGEKGSAYHKLLRAFPARFDYFWRQDAQGKWQLKQRWMLVA